MPRYNNRRVSRPTDRTVRAGTNTATAGTQSTMYMYTATDPCTATRFRLDIGTITELPCVYALVYVPEGYDVNTITYPATTVDLYNPTMNVLISGVITDNQVEDHKSSRYSRKLRIGDRIALILYNPVGNASAVTVNWELNFTTVH